MKNKIVADVEYAANLLLQIFLFLNVYLSAVWALLYGVYIWKNFSELWDIQGKLVILDYFTFSIAEASRLYFGYSGNLRAKIGDLSIFLLIIPIFQVPSLLFLGLSVRKYVILIITTYILSGFILVEFIIGIQMWRTHSYKQIQQYRQRLLIKSYYYQKTEHTKTENEHK